MRKSSVKTLKPRKNESGFTLIEVLVTLGIFAVIAIVTTSAIIALTNSASRFSETATNQNQVSTAIATINRDISSATTFTKAEDYLVEMTSNENNSQYDTTIFYYGPGTTVPDNVDKSRLPAFSAVIEQRQLVGSSDKPTIRILVPGFDSSFQTQKLFTYFGASNNQLTTPVTGDDNLSSISRVQFYVSAKVADRTIPIQMGSSAAPHSLGSETHNAGSAPTVPEAPFLKGALPSPSTTANLSWTIPEGATSYTLYRTNAGNTTVAAIIPDPNTNTYNDAGLTKGETYMYYVVASGPGGISPSSNQVSLTVSPVAPVIVNKNTTKQLADVRTTATEADTSYSYAGATYTVARNLVNQVTWKPSPGANGYYVYETGITAPIAKVASSVTSYKDTTPSYGDATTYTVMAWNSGENGSGGTSPVSNAANLISPPTAPTISSSASSDNSTNNIVTITSRPANSDGFKVYGTSSKTAAVAVACTSGALQGTVTNASPYTLTDAVGYGSSTCYAANGFNDAGDGPKGTSVLENKLPGPFSITAVTETSLHYDVTGYYGLASYGNNEDFNMKWSDGDNAKTYVVKKVGPTLGAVNNNGKISGSGSSSNNTTGNSITYGNSTPGAGYDLSVYGCAPWNTALTVSLCRSDTQAFLTSPDMPIEVHSIIQTRSASPWARKALKVYNWAKYGSVTNVQGRTWYDSQTTPSFSIFSGAVSGTDVAYSGAGNGGNTRAQVRSYLTMSGYGTKYSSLADWDGVIASSSTGCSTACGTSFSNVDESKPSYYEGHHAYWEAN